MLEHKKKKKQPRVAMLLRVPRGAQGDALEDQIVFCFLNGWNLTLRL